MIKSIFGASILGILLMVQNASACSFAPGTNTVKPAGEAIEEASVIFVGMVSAVGKQEHQEVDVAGSQYKSSYDAIPYTFKVESVWKGIVEPSAIVHHIVNTCFPEGYKVGNKYLVMADKTGAWITTHRAENDLITSHTRVKELLEKTRRTEDSF